MHVKNKNTLFNGNISWYKKTRKNPMDRKKQSAISILAMLLRFV
jgi:hypothetical protein